MTKLSDHDDRQEAFRRAANRFETQNADLIQRLAAAPNPPPPVRRMEDGWYAVATLSYTRVLGTRRLSIGLAPMNPLDQSSWNAVALTTPVTEDADSAVESSLDHHSHKLVAKNVRLEVGMRLAEEFAQQWTGESAADCQCGIPSAKPTKATKKPRKQTKPSTRRARGKKKPT